MKKVIAILLALSFLFGLAACSNTDSSQNAGLKPGGSNQGNSNQGGAQEDVQGGSSTEATTQTLPAETFAPDEAFSPYGTWVWEGNDKLTMTLNQDGTVHFEDKSDNSGWDTIPRVQALYFNDNGSFTYTEGQKNLFLHTKADDRQNDDEVTISVGYGYYMLKGVYYFNFVPAEHYEVAHEVFLNGPIYERMDTSKIIDVGTTYDLYPENEIKMTITKLELDSDYELKVYCTISAKTGISSFDWIQWTLYQKGCGSIMSNRVYFMDMSGNEVDGIGDGQKLEGYFTIEKTNSLLPISQIWYGDRLKACVYVGGMNMGCGFYFVLPEQPNC